MDKKTERVLILAGFLIVAISMFALGRNNASKPTEANNFVKEELQAAKDSLRATRLEIEEKDIALSDSRAREASFHALEQEQEYRIQRRDSKIRKLTRDYEKLKNINAGNMSNDSLDSIISRGRLNRGN